VEQGSGTTPTGTGAAQPEQDTPAAHTPTDVPGTPAAGPPETTTAGPSGTLAADRPSEAPATGGPSETPALAPQAPGFRARGRARRRARFLRRARELAYRDLGGLVFNLHRFGQRNDPLVLAKLNTLAHLDGELRAVEALLHERQPITVLREAGITACPRCAAIHGSEDNFCPNCGLPVDRHVDLPAGFQPGGAAAAAQAPAVPAAAVQAGAAPASVPAVPPVRPQPAAEPKPGSRSDRSPTGSSPGPPVGGRAPVPPTSRQPGGSGVEPVPVHAPEEATEILRPPTRTS
jgi:hypothetical protein